VVEGIGDHGCEYMTGGLVVVLGTTGKNFAAGMSGGIAYILDTEGTFPDRVNKEMIELEELSEGDFERVRIMVRNHFSYTSSKVALDLLNNWEQRKRELVKVMPVDYKAVLEAKNMAPAMNVKVAEVMD
jgi:glutamate synthase (NADPH/NADH) large chain